MPGQLGPCNTPVNLFCVLSGTPAAPSIPRIMDTHADSISLAWSRPVEEGGAEVIGYILEMQEVGTEEWKKAHEKTLRGTEYVVTGLSAATKYYFRVAGVNINGTGDFSEPCAATEPVERIGKTLSDLYCHFNCYFTQSYHCGKDMPCFFLKKDIQFNGWW